MARNGSGTFNRLYDWTDDAAASVKISSTRMDAEMDGMATALTDSLAKDGQTTPTANLPMGTFRHTGVGAATARTDYARASQDQDSSLKYASAGGTADAITLTLAPAITAYAAGQRFHFIASGTNTGAVTLNVSGVGATAVKKAGGTALVAGDIVSGQAVDVIHDGTDFELLNIAAVGLAGTQTIAGDKTFSGAVTVNGALTASGTITGIPGRLSAVQTYTAGATWTKPSGLSFVIVEAVGAGGGGGGSDQDGSGGGCGGGGGGGGYSRKKIAAASLGATETVSIGAAGAAGTAGNNTGGTGGNTTFGAHVTANGGTGGGSHAAGTTVVTAARGTGGTATGGDLNISGQSGGYGLRKSSTEVYSGGGGSAAGFGLGAVSGIALSSSSAGVAGTGYGAGGGGAASVTASTDQAGGAGTAGLVLVYEYV